MYNEIRPSKKQPGRIIEGIGFIMENLEAESLGYLEDLYGKLIELKKLTGLMLDTYLSNTEVFEVENNYENMQILGNAIFEMLSNNIELTRNFIESQIN